MQQSEEVYTEVCGAKYVMEMSEQDDTKQLQGKKAHSIYRVVPTLSAFVWQLVF